MSNDWINLTIKSWDKYNVRRDVKKCSWFKLSHDLFEDPDFYHFSHSELCVWIFLLSLASKKSLGTIRVSFAHAMHIGRFEKSDILSAIEKLIELDCIHIHDTHTIRERYVDDTQTLRLRYAHDTSPVRKRPRAIPTRHARLELEEIREENTNALKKEELEQISAPLNSEKELEQNGSPLNAELEIDQNISALLFEEVYKKYPRKRGKADGLKICRREIKYQSDYEKLILALDKFIEYHVQSNTQEQFIPYFSTFMNSWRDWLDPDVGTSTIGSHADPFSLIRNEESA